MALLTEAEARGYALRAIPASATFSESVKKSAASENLRRYARFTANAGSPQRYTIFLSHSFRDQILILGVTEYLKSFGYSVYVDWLEDSELDRSQVTKDSARKLRQRMDSCSCLLFATTTNHGGSKWMPWELGYFDGKFGRAGIFPLAQSTNTTDAYAGQEYLGLYPYLVRNSNHPYRDHLYMHNSASKFIGFDQWVKGENPPE